MAHLLLRSDKVEETALALANRIRERFPDAGLAGMCDDLALLARDADRTGAVAHVVDMRQLTKDPSLFAIKPDSTKSSPERSLNLNDTARYLNYCTEMLAIVGKIAAIYTQRFDDPVALASAAEIEVLSTGLSSKIWQKIVIAEDTSDGQ